jgi:hypothetical protein
MNLLRTTALSSLGLLALVVPRPLVSTLGFAPEEGSELIKTFKLSFELTLDSMEMLMNDEPSPMAPEIESASSETHQIVVRDRYVSVSEGAPTELHRTFVEMTKAVGNDMEMSMAGQDMSADLHASGTCGLVGKTVIFKREEGGEDYEKSFGEEGGDEELLAGLVEDMDLRALLPSGEVEEGDRWDIDLDELANILYAGGAMAWEMESDGDDPPAGVPDPAHDPDSRELLGEFEGDATATFEGMREVDGRSLAVVSLAVDVHSEVDAAELYQDVLERSSQPGIEIEIDSITIQYVFEGGGEMFWDMEAGHIVSLQLEGELANEHDQHLSIDAGGQSIKIQQRSETSGTLKLAVTTE